MVVDPRITVVMGPPAGGKASFVDFRRVPGDPVVDYDRIAQALGSPDRFQHPEFVKQVSWAARIAAIARVFDGGDRDAWIIAGNLAHDLIEAWGSAGARFVVVDPGIDVALSNAVASGREPGIDDVIRAWYEDPPKVPAKYRFDDAPGEGAGWSFAMKDKSMSPPGVDAWASITQDGSTGEVRIYEQIGAWGVTAADVAAQISALDVSTLNVFVNSPGGDAYDGIAIMNALKRHKATVNVTVDGLAASAASVLCMGGDRVVMARGAQFMVHDTWTYSVGNAAELRAAAVQLDKLSDSYADCYAAKAGGDREEWRARMQAETWFTADEAVTAGLADEVHAVEPVERVEARASAFDLAEFGYKGRTAVAKASAVEPEKIDDEGVDVSELRSDLVGRLGLGADATDEDILAAVVKPSAAVAPEGVAMIDAGMLAALQADAAAGRAAAEAQALTRQESAVSAAVREGRIAPTAKATWLDRMKADEAGTTALLGTLAAGAVAAMVELGHAGSVENGESELYARVYGGAE